MSSLSNLKKLDRKGSQQSYIKKSQMLNKSQERFAETGSVAGGLDGPVNDPIVANLESMTGYLQNNFHKSIFNLKTQSKTNSQIVGQFQDDPDDEIARMQSTQAVEHNVKDLIRDGAEFYFRDQADDNLAKQAQSAGVNNVVIRQKSRWARFLEQSVYCTDYPVELTTPEELMGEYFRRRTPPEYRAGFFQLLGLGVCSVISGEFSGWNGGMLQSGYFGFWIANLLSAIMYLGLAGSLAELSSTLPVVGGSFAYARAIVGDSFAFVLGHAENLEYTTFCTLILVGFTGFLREHFSIERNYEPLIWFCLLIPCTYIVTYHNRSLWNIFVAGMVFCGLQIIVFCIMGMYFFDAKQITVGWPEDPHHPKHEIDWKFGLGVGGILQALHNTSWWYTGFECLTLAAHETRAPVTKNITKSLFGSWLYLTLCAIFLTLFNVLIPPGTGIMAKSLYPMVDGFAAFFNLDKDKGKLHLIFYEYPSQIFNLLAMLWCVSRQTWALSRAGFVPKFWSVTHIYSNKMPGRTLLFMNMYIIAMCFFVFLFPDLEPGLSTFDALLALCVMAASFFYIGVSIVYLVFYFKFPNITRPYKSPFGQWGAWCSLCISLLLVIAKIGLSHVFQITFAIFVVKLGIFAVFYIFHGRFHLLPTEDIIINILYQEERKFQQKDQRIKAERRRSVMARDIAQRSVSSMNHV